MIHPWLRHDWERLVSLAGRLPHALLFIGPAGLGKRELAEELAARLLCDAPRADGVACGQCAACQWRLSGNHPDFYRVVPAAEAEKAENAEKGEAVAEGEGGSGKAKSAQIVIEQIRDLQAALAVTGHHSARRVAIIDPAEAMNVFTANALLKLLEEPPEGCTFLLVSSAPRRLLPTIRSRCQQWAFSRPSAEQLEAWRGSAPEAAGELLALVGGMPLAAERLKEGGGAALFDRFVRDLAQLPGGDPLRLAGQWEVWLKSKEAIAAGFGIAQLIDWMQRWVADLAALRLGGRIRFFPAQQGALAALAARANVAGMTNCYNEFAQIRRVAQHPLNMRLVLEDMLLRYARALNGAKG